MIQYNTRPFIEKIAARNANMNLIYTICSINYLAQAFTLGQSIQKTNPDFRFVIGLMDKFVDKPPIDLAQYGNPEIILVEDIGIDDFAGMCHRYNITELNTAVKPYFALYFFGAYPEVQNVIYLDPDIIVYQPLTHLLQNLEDNNVVITPHICSPYNDEKRLNEEDHCNSGIYNLGFVAMHRAPETTRFLEWWAERLRTKCKMDFKNGMFVDQLWINLAPVFFEKVRVEKHLGYNVAYWNLHERKVNQRGEQYWVNDQYELQFFHFSGYNINAPEVLSVHQDRFQLSDRPDIQPLFAQYRNTMAQNGQAFFKQFRCSYIKESKRTKFNFWVGHTLDKFFG